MKVRTGITVREFYARHGEALQLALLGPVKGFERRIKEPTINRPGLALSGFFSYFAEKRMQVLGSAEMAFLRSLPEAEARQRLRAVFARRIPCLIVARNMKPSKPLLEEAARANIALFHTPLVTMNFINDATLALEEDFAATKSEYGSMVDILGIGTIVRGSSGIGKSEAVLGLIERGHSLVSDDITRLRVSGGVELVGTSPEITRHHMEVRGLGIINVMAIFGAGAVRHSKKLDLMVTLKDWQEMEEVDRIGLEQDFYEILGIRIPHVTIPVRMGRDLARLIETAALDQKLKGMGRHCAQEFNQRLLNSMQKTR